MIACAEIRYCSEPSSCQHGARECMETLTASSGPTHQDVLPRRATGASSCWKVTRTARMSFYKVAVSLRWRCGWSGCSDSERLPLSARYSRAALQAGSPSATRRSTPRSASGLRPSTIHGMSLNEVCGSSRIMSLSRHGRAGCVEVHRTAAERVRRARLAASFVDVLPFGHAW